MHNNRVTDTAAALAGDCTDISGESCSHLRQLDKQSYGFLSITCHYIDGNCRLLSQVLQARAIEASHTVTHFAELLTKALREWELTDRVTAVTAVRRPT